MEFNKHDFDNSNFLHAKLIREKKVSGSSSCWQSFQDITSTMFYQVRLNAIGILKKLLSDAERSNIYIYVYIYIFSSEQILSIRRFISVHSYRLMLGNIIFKLELICSLQVRSFQVVTFILIPVLVGRLIFFHNSQILFSCILLIHR